MLAACQSPSIYVNPIQIPPAPLLWLLVPSYPGNSDLSLDPLLLKEITKER
jgi:hypothetical protein